MWNTFKFSCFQAFRLHWKTSQKWYVLRVCIESFTFIQRLGKLNSILYKYHMKQLIRLSVWKKPSSSFPKIFRFCSCDNLELHKYFFLSFFSQFYKSSTCFQIASEIWFCGFFFWNDLKQKLSATYGWKLNVALLPCFYLNLFGFGCSFILHFGLTRCRFRFLFNQSYFVDVSKSYYLKMPEKEACS